MHPNVPLQCSSPRQLQPHLVRASDSMLSQKAACRKQGKEPAEASGRVNRKGAWAPSQSSRDWSLGKGLRLLGPSPSKKLLSGVKFTVVWASYYGVEPKNVWESWETALLVTLGNRTGIGRWKSSRYYPSTVYIDRCQLLIFMDIKGCHVLNPSCAHAHTGILIVTTAWHLCPGLWTTVTQTLSCWMGHNGKSQSKEQQPPKAIGGGKKKLKALPKSLHVLVMNLHFWS